MLKFQEGIKAALEAGDGLAGALHTPQWCRAHLDEARLLLLYHRDDFVQGDWPEMFRGKLAEQARRGAALHRKFTRDPFGHAGPNEMRRAQFIISEVPVAAVKQHLLRRRKPPLIVDELIRTTYNAIVREYRISRLSPLPP